jgi:Polyketide cyclase / dehydrase and lipid transport
VKPKFQSKQSVVINAPLEKVWEFGMDLSRIPAYHPRVDKIDLMSGKQFREPGVSYQCHLSDGKNTCVEKDIEIVPMEKVVTIFLSDTMGLTKLLPDYLVETTLKKIDNQTTQVDISHFYSSSKWKVRVFNIFIKWKVGKETQETLKSMKKAIENDY